MVMIRQCSTEARTVQHKKNSVTLRIRFVSLQEFRETLPGIPGNCQVPRGLICIIFDNLFVHGRDSSLSPQQSKTLDSDVRRRGARYF